MKKSLANTLPTSINQTVLKTATDTRTPESLSTPTILGVISAALGSNLQLRTNAHRLTRANLYCLAFGPSGMGMSEVFRILTAPLRIWQQEHRQQWEEEKMLLNRMEQAALEISYREAIKDLGTSGGGGEWVEKTSEVLGRTISWARSEYQRGGGKEERRENLLRIMADRMRLEKEGHAPLLITDTPSPAELARLLHWHNESLASLSPDAGPILEKLLAPPPRNPTEVPTPVMLYRHAHDGEVSSGHREDKDNSFTLQAPCLSILWMVREPWLRRWFSSRDLSESDLPSRFLTCRIQDDPDLDISSLPHLTEKDIDNHARLITTLLETFHDREEPAIVECSARAATYFRQQEDRIHRSRHKTPGALLPYVLRQADHAHRIALVLHAATHPADAEKHPLSLENARLACKLAAYFTGQAKAILEEQELEQRTARENQVLDLLDDLGGEITPRDLQRKRISESATEAQQLLESIEGLKKDFIKRKEGGADRLVFRESE